MERRGIRQRHELIAGNAHQLVHNRRRQSIHLKHGIRQNGRERGPVFRRRATNRREHQMQITIPQMLGLKVARSISRRRPEPGEAHQAFGQHRTVRACFAQRHTPPTQHFQRRRTAVQQFPANQQVQRIDAERRDLPHIRIGVRRTTAQHEPQIELAFVDRGTNRFRVRAGHAFQCYAGITNFAADVLRHPRTQRADLAAAEPQMDRRAAVHADVIDSGPTDEQHAEDAECDSKPPTFGRHAAKPGDEMTRTSAKPRRLACASSAVDGEFECQQWQASRSAR